MTPAVPPWSRRSAIFFIPSPGSISWPAGGPRTRLVAILDGIDPAEVEDLWAGFLGPPAIDRPDAAALMRESGRGLFD